MKCKQLDGIPKKNCKEMVGTEGEGVKWVSTTMTPILKEKNSTTLENLEKNTDQQFIW